MSFFAHVFGSARTTGNFHPQDPSLATFFGFVPSAAGMNVDEYVALNYTSVWACVRMISEAIASVPLPLYEIEGSDDQGRPITRHAVDDDLYELFQVAPNYETAAMPWREAQMAHVLTWGNAYSGIERTGQGRPANLWQLSPREVRPDRSKSGKLIYQISGDGSDVPEPAENILHVPGLGFDGLVGYNVVRMAREALGLGMAQERFAATFFGNGAQPGGLIEHPGQPTRAAVEESKRSWEAMHQGPDRAHRLGFLWGGIKYNKDSGLIPPDEAQFLESREFQRSEICLWFNMPAMKLGVRQAQTYASAAQYAEDFVKHTLRPWCERWENEFRRKLMTRQERRRLYFRHDLDSLLRGDLQSRTTARAAQFMNGAINIDEWRAGEDMNPLPGGKGQAHYRAANLVEVGKEPEPAVQNAVPLPGRSAADRPGGNAAIAPSLLPRLQSEMAALFVRHRAERAALQCRQRGIALAADQARDEQGRFAGEDGGETSKELADRQDREEKELADKHAADDKAVADQRAAGKAERIEKYKQEDAERGIKDDGQLQPYQEGEEGRVKDREKAEDDDRRQGQAEEESALADRHEQESDARDERHAAQREAMDARHEREIAEIEERHQREQEEMEGRQHGEALSRPLQPRASGGPQCEAPGQERNEKGEWTADGAGAAPSKFAGEKVGKAEHVRADAIEKEVAAGVGGAHEPDNKPFDALKGKDAIEVKSLLKGEKQSLSMHPDALVRKVDDATAQDHSYHTVAVDDRQTYEGGKYADKFSGQRLYYKRGADRYSLSEMQPVKDMAELKKLINMPDRDLPEKARGSLPAGEKLTSLRDQAEKTHAYRIEANRKRREQGKI